MPRIARAVASEFPYHIVQRGNNREEVNRMCPHLNFMKIIRNHTSLKKLPEHEDCYVDASPKERISFMWELTAELWSLKGMEYVERRLQRNVTNLIKK